jgi:1,4-dihydroxy-2-naphthoyl-CoA hydrolase
MTSAGASGAEKFENNPGLLKLLGIAVEEASPDRAVLTMEVGPDHLQPHGVTHGGIYATLVESAASIGAHLWINAQAGAGTVVGVANSTDFLRPFTGGRLTATATPIHRGRSAQLWAVEITSDNGKLISRGQVRLHNMTDPT